VPLSGHARDYHVRVVGVVEVVVRDEHAGRVGGIQSGVLELLKHAGAGVDVQVRGPVLEVDVPGGSGLEDRREPPPARG
jgi:hypothetical protein